MIRVFFDTNVWVSALISRGGSPAALIDLWLDGAFDVVVSPKLLTEIDAILAAPRLRRWVTADDATEFVALLGRTGVVIDDPSDPPRICRDPKDDFLFAAAAAGSCQAICSGDLDLAAVTDPPVPVLTPAALLELIGRE
jgi:putative PIN family toxin of toxin-antitoxin system